MKLATCVHFIDPVTQSVLLAYQQAKIIGRKGYGGTMKENEGSLACTAREVSEETGGIKEFRINPDQEGGIIFDIADLVPVALIDFYNGPEDEVEFGDPTFRVLFYNCYKFSGHAIDTVEMRDPWFYPINNLPIDLVPGDLVFLPDILQGKMLTGWIRRTKDFKTILDSQIEACQLSDLII